MQPSSMMRSPSLAFNPVVSVSSTMQRILALPFFSSRPPASAPERLDAEVGEPVGALVLRMACVPAHPVPRNAVRAREPVELLPQVDVLHRLLVRRAPAAALPVGQPFADAFLDVLRVGIDLDHARTRE